MPLIELFVSPTSVLDMFASCLRGSFVFIGLIGIHFTSEHRLIVANMEKKISVVVFIIDSSGLQLFP